MARAIDNVVIKGFSGTVGKQITFSQRAGKTIVGKTRRKSTLPVSDKSIAVRTRFAASIGYAKTAIKDAATKSLYKAMAAPDQSAFNLAFRDAFLPPVFCRGPAPASSRIGIRYTCLKLFYFSFK